MERRRQYSSNLLLVGVLLASMLGGMRETAAMEVGEKAPDFTLLSTTGEKISLSQFQGKQFVLIEFYGTDFAPVCAANLSARKADYSKFQHLNVQVIAINADNPFSQKAFADSLKLPYPLLSDLGLKVARAYGVLYGLTGAKVDYPGNEGLLAGRAFFLVDQHGIVRGKWIGEDLAAFPNDVLLKAAQEVAEKH
jgi:thioredoxin-dependent peroxiredoxin